MTLNNNNPIYYIDPWGAQAQQGDPPVVYVDADGNLYTTDKYYAIEHPEIYYRSNIEIPNVSLKESLSATQLDITVSDVMMESVNFVATVFNWAMNQDVLTTESMRSSLSGGAIAAGIIDAIHQSGKTPIDALFFVPRMITDEQYRLAINAMVMNPLTIYENFRDWVDVLDQEHTAAGQYEAGNWNVFVRNVGTLHATSLYSTSLYSTTLHATTPACNDPVCNIPAFRHITKQIPVLNDNIFLCISKQ